ncbi:hypothetical protein Stsp02_27090 [Streptomyces sp. NBRC 14336]|uniref:hypothetical protein n=1 Tax=Streptomyces sp. NBRC 14336 TaxID=3030992 RepID=UPI0024A5CD84|nr:hypothetical protein [Streptomyces sp. NBRC 14336]GLW47047.1 hypothetical protein Stsp02_27090 [Streptomyces sp. NBRC 14336]
MSSGMVRAFTGLFRGRGRADEHAEELARVEAEITAFGQTLARHPFVPDHQAHDVELLADYQQALDAYERAKRDSCRSSTPRAGMSSVYRWLKWARSASTSGTTSGRTRTVPSC